MKQMSTEEIERLTPKAAWRLADRLARSGEHAGARALYAQAERGLPYDPRPAIRRGRCCQALGDLEGARKAFARAQEIAPGNAAARFFLAQVKMDAGDGERARTLLSQVIEKQPENLAAICLESLAGYLAGEKREALADWETSFSANTDFLPRLVLALETDRMRESAGQPFRSADKLDRSDRSEKPDSRLAEKASSRRLLSMCQRALDDGDATGAVAAARRLTQLRPKDPEALFIRGWVAIKAGLFEEAERSLRLALRFQRREDVRRRLGRCRAMTRDRVRTAREKTSFEPGATALRGLALARLGRCDEARDVLRSVPVEGPESYNKFYYMGLCALADGRREAALRHLQYAFERYGADTMEYCLPELMDWAHAKYA